MNCARCGGLVSDSLDCLICGRYCGATPILAKIPAQSFDGYIALVGEVFNPKRRTYTPKRYR